MAFFSVLGVVCFTTLSTVLMRQPLYDLRTDDMDWLRHWLFMTVLDYYGAALPLCAVIVANEPNSTTGLLWSLGCLLGGSPFCCAWVVKTLWKGDGYRYP